MSQPEGKQGEGKCFHLPTSVNFYFTSNQIILPIEYIFHSHIFFNRFFLEFVSHNTFEHNIYLAKFLGEYS